MTFNLPESLDAYERKLLDPRSELELFAYLIKTGKAWNLNEQYTNAASSYIGTGYIDNTGNILKKVNYD